MERLDATAQTGSASYTVGGQVEYERFRPKATKDLIDEADRHLGTVVGLSPEQIDFVINYDIKYRLGRDEEDDDE